ncbi:hypothetical protein BDV35DRAFT_379884 [Aspergillus flavus]|uniref:DNA, SC003 n=2 Tax=Aspergillus subgen. Circumdati TaxID=2720871 RepID=Q2UJD3_ASPOR|nr:unnamed protein product [Aspergillus oryzae RIB40]KAB8247333.1 hypothetical protein BDV35DRAFT_379884 [Aspergillus flavus]BAE58332.1 unnamed protein product [Aspergillus oryzae RIB40]
MKIVPQSLKTDVSNTALLGAGMPRERGSCNSRSAYSGNHFGVLLPYDDFDIFVVLETVGASNYPSWEALTLGTFPGRARKADACGDPWEHPSGPVAPKFSPTTLHHLRRAIRS